MVLVAALQADDGQGGFGQLFGEIHGELSGLDDFAFAGARLDAVDGDVEVVADHLLDVVDGDFAVGAFDEFVDHLASQVEGDVAVVE